MGQISLVFQNKTSIDAEYTKLTLNEYMSKPFKAVIECNVTKQNNGINNDFLNNSLSYVNEYVYIKVSQKYSDKSTSYRYISGQITNISYKGISKKDDKNNKYSYEITVQPPFIDLMKVRKNKNYSGKNIKEIIQEILDAHNIGNYDLSEINENDLLRRSNKIFFHQTDETDYDFLMKLLLYYGINYYFIHTDKNSKDKATIKFISGKLPDVQFMNFDEDNRHINKLYLNLDSSDISVGVFNNVVIDYSSNIEIKNKTISLHSFEYGNSINSIVQESADKILIKKNIEASLSYKKNTINLSSTYVCAGINSKIQIKGYIPDESVVSDIYLIKSTTTVYNNESNEKDNIDIYGFFADDTKESHGIISEDIENNAALYFDNKQAYNVPLFTNNAVEAKSIPSSDLAGNQTTLIEATVCDKDGKTDTASISVPENCDPHNHNTFYAKLKNGSDTKDDVVTVTMVVPYGSNNYCIYNYPKVGSNILLFRDNNSKYYMFGYMPNISDITANSGSVYNDYLHLGAPEQNYITLRQENSIVQLIRSAQIDAFMSEAYAYINMQCIQNEYEQKTSTHNVNGKPEILSIKNWCEELKKEYNNKIKIKSDKISELDITRAKPDGDNEKINSLKDDVSKIENEIQTLESEIEDAGNQIYNIFENAKSNIDKDETCNDKEGEKNKIDGFLQNNCSINVNSSNVDINSKNSVDIKGNDRLNLFSKDNGIEISSTNNTIHLKALKSIKLSVGSNVIEINQDKISLIARKWMTSAGPTDSSITLKSISGVEMNGLSCSMNGLFSSSMSDGFGGSVVTDMGSSRLQGYHAGIYTLKGMDAIFKSSINMVKLIFQFGSIMQEEKIAHGMNIARYILDSLQSSYDIGNKCYNILQNAKTKNYENKTDIVFEIFNVICMALDRIASITELENTNYTNDAASPKSNATQRDAVRLMLMTMKTIIAINIFIKTACNTSNFLASGKMEFTGAHKTAKFTKIENVSQEKKDNYSIIK